MGGGDLNSKKSWHPNTIKNQERVWKAEQASAEEKKRIVELQRERAAERDRADLNQLARRTAGASSADDNRLHWMYDKPDKKVNQEDFLLGKAIDNNFEADKAEQQDYIPAVARRVVGSSMLATAGDAQVDLARKMREDPLMLVKERERAARAALLNNPLQRRRLTELLRKEQEKRNQKKEKKKPKKDKDLDSKLAAKLTALGEKQIDLATLLASNDSSSDSSSEEEQKKSKKKHKKSKKHKKEKKKSKHRQDSEEDSSGDESDRHQNKPCAEKDRASYTRGESKRGVDSDSDNQQRTKRYRSNEKTQSRSDKHSPRRDSRTGDRRDERRKSQERRRRTPDRAGPRRSEERKYGPQERRPRKSDDRTEYKKKPDMSSEERAAKLAAMAAAGAEREEERGRRVAGERAAAAAAERRAAAAAPRAVRTEAHELPDSLETRIHSNRHYIQRDRTHMDKHFARR